MQPIAHFFGDLTVTWVIDEIRMLGRIKEQVIKTLTIQNL